MSAEHRITKISNQSHLFCDSPAAEVDVEKKVDLGIFFRGEDVRDAFGVVPKLETIGRDPFTFSSGHGKVG